MQKSNSVFIDFESWIIECRKQYEQIYIDNFTDYENRFEYLSKKYNAILKEKDLKNESEAWDFSIFSIVSFLTHIAVIFQRLPANQQFAIQGIPI